MWRVSERLALVREPHRQCLDGFAGVNAGIFMHVEVEVGWMCGVCGRLCIGIGREAGVSWGFTVVARVFLEFCPCWQ